MTRPADKDVDVVVEGFDAVRGWARLRTRIAELIPAVDVLECVVHPAAYSVPVGL